MGAKANHKEHIIQLILEGLVQLAPLIIQVATSLKTQQQRR
jgi:hypothetical protein